MQHGKIKILFFPRNVHTERIGAGPCMACDHAPKEKKSYGKNSWEIWEKLGIGGKKLWETWEKLGNLWEKKSEYGKNWVRFRKFLCPFQKAAVIWAGQNYPNATGSMVILNMANIGDQRVQIDHSNGYQANTRSSDIHEAPHDRAQMQLDGLRL